MVIKEKDPILWRVSIKHICPSCKDSFDSESEEDILCGNCQYIKDQEERIID